MITPGYQRSPTDSWGRPCISWAPLLVRASISSAHLHCARITQRPLQRTVVSASTTRSIHSHFLHQHSCSSATRSNLPLPPKTPRLEPERWGALTPPPWGSPVLQFLAQLVVIHDEPCPASMKRSLSASRTNLQALTEEHVF